MRKIKKVLLPTINRLLLQYSKSHIYIKCSADEEQISNVSSPDLIEIIHSIDSRCKLYRATTQGYFLLGE